MAELPMHSTGMNVAIPPLFDADMLNGFSALNDLEAPTKLLSPRRMSLLTPCGAMSVPKGACEVSAGSAAVGHVFMEGILLTTAHSKQGLFPGHPHGPGAAPAALDARERALTESTSVLYCEPLEFDLERDAVLHAHQASTTSGGSPGTSCSSSLPAADGTTVPKSVLNVFEQAGNAFALPATGEQHSNPVHAAPTDAADAFRQSVPLRRVPPALDIPPPSLLRGFSFNLPGTGETPSNMAAMWSVGSTITPGLTPALAAHMSANEMNVLSVPGSTRVLRGLPLGQFGAAVINAPGSTPLAIMSPKQPLGQAHPSGGCSSEADTFTPTAGTQGSRTPVLPRLFVAIDGQQLGANPSEAARGQLGAAGPQGYTTDGSGTLGFVGDLVPDFRIGVGARLSSAGSSTVTLDLPSAPDELLPAPLEVTSDSSELQWSASVVRAGVTASRVLQSAVRCLVPMALSDTISLSPTGADLPSAGAKRHQTSALRYPSLRKRCRRDSTTEQLDSSDPLAWLSTAAGPEAHSDFEEDSFEVLVLGIPPRRRQTRAPQLLQPPVPPVPIRPIVSRLRQLQYEDICRTMPILRLILGEALARTADTVLHCQGSLALIAESLVLRNRTVLPAVGVYATATPDQPATDSPRMRRLALWHEKRSQLNWNPEAQVRYPHRAEVVARRNRAQGRFS